ncbi:hypothetical protein ACX800_09920 [Paenarthrobacter nitroguajacolicus]|uniref:hypothetical protein n=1 Tax=Paenarthrobacter nitroguajacolicus TaxID=211146 RepID=UPI003D2104A6
MSTERDMLNLLADRYTDVREGTIADRWVRAEHVRLKAESYYGNRIADFVAGDKWNSTLALHGHEVKVSRSDWLSELRDPDKAKSFKRYMHHWWLVVPDAAIVKPGELPDGWGLLVETARGLRAKVKAPLLQPEPAPLELIINLMAAASRTAHREPIYRNAPVAHVKDWTPKCGFCGELSPCGIHQRLEEVPRALPEDPQGVLDLGGAA